MSSLWYRPINANNSLLPHCGAPCCARPCARVMSLQTGKPGRERVHWRLTCIGRARIHHRTSSFCMARGETNTVFSQAFSQVRPVFCRVRVRLGARARIRCRIKIRMRLALHMHRCARKLNVCNIQNPFHFVLHLSWRPEDIMPSAESKKICQIPVRILPDSCQNPARFLSEFGAPASPLGPRFVQICYTVDQNGSQWPVVLVHPVLLKVCTHPH